jgi:hypothetical protein
MSGHRKVFVAVPVYGGLDPFFAQSLLRLATDPPCNMALRMHIGDSLVARARNSLTRDFLESDCSHLLFIDSDLIFGPEHVARILAHEEDVVGGMYPKKQEGAINWVVNGCRSAKQARPDGLLEVQYIGTGFLRVSRRVFEAMIDRWGMDLRYAPDHATHLMEYDFWSVGTYEYPDGYRRYLSEDWYFCQRWLDLGGKVWADTKIVLKHVGTAVYPLKAQEHELFGAAPAQGPATSQAGGEVAPAPAWHHLPGGVL